MKKTIILTTICILLWNCQSKKNITEQAPFDWKAANVYFLLTDRFANGDPSNDNLIKRDLPTGVLRGFMGGDLKGITQKIEEGYFTNLGINAIWMTPIVEQIHGAVDEGTGNTYGFHGYWTKDWTAIDPSYGTKADLKELVEKAHAKGIRIVLDAVINHTGPVTELDPVFPDSWVRTKPKCTYDTYKNYIDCTLVENLPDIKTESNEAVELPPMLVEKWKKEGRYEEEVRELDAFFAKTGYPRAPKYYIMKWLADYITDFGIDGYRVDTVKHTTEDVWADFAKVCKDAFAAYKTLNPKKVLDDNDFFLVGEVYGYGLHGKQIFDFGDKKVNYFENGFDFLINFDFKGDANKGYEELFNYYNIVLQNEMGTYSVMNYLTSHDDGWPFDKKRERTFEAATKLLLTPGVAQVYYGDETARSLVIEGTQGDATLRSFMNWEDLQSNAKTKALLTHYQKLGTFRANHPAVGAGKHVKISDTPYTFSRTYQKGDFKDATVIALDAPKGAKTIQVSNAFAEGSKVRDAYSGVVGEVKNGKVEIHSNETIVLLEKM
jgi:alpha-amylase